MPKSLNMNYVNCALLVVVLILVVMCCMNKSNEGFWGARRRAKRADKARKYAAQAKQLEASFGTGINPYGFRGRDARMLKRQGRQYRRAKRRSFRFR